MAAGTTVSAASCPRSRPDCRSPSGGRTPTAPTPGPSASSIPSVPIFSNHTGRDVLCTDALGQETEDDATLDDLGFLSCPDDQILQRVATTRNLWFGRASWGQDEIRGDLSGSAVNARGPNTPAGYGHEWVRFFDAPGIHAPN